MTLNGVTLPPVAVLNTPNISSSLEVMCVGTENNRQLELRFSNSPLPNPVVPGVYRSQFDSITFNVASYDNAIIVSISNIDENPTFESFNCTSLESFAIAKLFITNGKFNCRYLCFTVHARCHILPNTINFHMRTLCHA